jgi:hypothetical protein
MNENAREHAHENARPKFTKEDAQRAAKALGYVPTFGEALGAVSDEPACDFVPGFATLVGLIGHIIVHLKLESVPMPTTQAVKAGALRTKLDAQKHVEQIEKFLNDEAADKHKA